MSGYTVDDLRKVLRDTDSVVFSNGDLATYRDTFPDSIFRAASMAIRSLAIEYAAKSKSVKTDDLAIDLRSRGTDLLKVADSFLADAVAADADNDYFDIVPFAGRPHPAVVRPEASPWPYPWSVL